MSIDLSPVNVPAELDRLGWKYELIGDEAKTRCPAHDDSHASCSLNIDKKVWKCHAAGCGKSGDIVTFIAAALNTDRRTVYYDLSQRYPIGGDQLSIDPTKIEQFHQKIWSNPGLLLELRKRGVSDEAIKRHRLGVNDGRVIIPVKDENNFIVNMRRYLPGASGASKFKNSRGRGKIRLYPIEQLRFDKIVVCGGEIKAIVVADRLNALGIGAISATAGEGNWTAEFSKALSGKHVWVCFDVDTAGRVAANRVCGFISRHVRWVGAVDLPLDPNKYPHGDVNDYFGLEKRTTEEFVALLDATQKWEAPDGDDLTSPDEPATDLSIAEVTLAENAKRRVRVEGVVTALDSAPYLVPKHVRCDCDRNQEFCGQCPVYAAHRDDDSFVELTISPESPAILHMVNAPEVVQREAIRRGLGIPPCKVVTFYTLEQYNVEELRVSPQLEIASQAPERAMLPTMAVAHGIESNTAYRFEGRILPHPRTQQAVLLASRIEPADDALTRFAPTHPELAALTVFQPSEWSVDALDAKLNEVYADLEANVTRIYRRRELHLVIDLAYHSVLVFDFDGKQTKGWVEVLVIGDSAQGKTETSKQLMEHYGLGEKIECKNATVAGLLGGVQQLGSGRWFVTWGIIPTHDRRLVILEELKGADVEVIGRLTDMRSSGIAEIPKIEKQRTFARTRLIALSNPRRDGPMSTYNYGVQAVHELVGNVEDVRRFDLAVSLLASQVDPAELNQLASHRPHVEQRYDRTLCKRLILWAWTRDRDQVCFDDGTTDAVLAAAARLSTKYTDVVPLIDRGSVRFKIARLSAALAARTFSTDDDRECVVVRPCHVDYVTRFIDDRYSDVSMGYADFSRSYIDVNTLLEADGIRRRLLSTPFPRDFVRQMLATEIIDARDVMDWCGWEKEDSLDLVSFLVRKHALKRQSRGGYCKTADFIVLLKQLRDSPEMDIADRPSHVSETTHKEF